MIADSAAGDGPATALAPVRWAAQLPDPARFWVRFAPRAWPGPETGWCDLAAGRLGASRTGLDPRGTTAFDDLVYLPPVAEALEERRQAYARELSDAGTPVLLQRLLESGPPSLPEAESATVVVDLLPALLERRAERLDAVRGGVAVIWPLIPGLTDDEPLWRDGCGRLAQRGVEIVQPLVLALSPGDRRRLAEGDERLFEALFHGHEPSERAFSTVAAEFGLRAWLDRPVAERPRRVAANRRLAGALTLAAELWLGLGRSPSLGMALSRAAHWIDASGYDVAALAREGNLGVVPEIDAESRQAIEGWAATGRLELLEELQREYLSGE